ncbi:MAG: peptide ABC transporter substrate-binding protein [Treponema sp.]|nr:peptide ABC transporter substrate-binding protein [Treponema sp.]
MQINISPSPLRSLPWILILLLFFWGAPLFAQAEDEQGSENLAIPRPPPLARDELAVTFSSGDLELDFRQSIMASEAQIFTAIYEGLFSYHPLTMEPVAAAAYNWEVSEDRRTWTFSIREGARFQNGDPLRAEDFRAAWFSMIDPQRNAPYSSMFDVIEGALDYRLGRGRAEDVGIWATAEKTLVVRLISPAAFFPSMLCHHSFSPIHPSMVDEENWLETWPVSNGPFFISEMDEKGIVFSKNPYYWDNRSVELNRLEIIFVDDGEEASALWNSGVARWIYGDVNIDQLNDLSGIQVNAMFATHYYFVRSAREPWNDFRLRQALALALPWEEIRENHFLPASTLIYPIPGYPEVEGLERTDLEEARQLLADAGYPQGVGLPELVIRITPSWDAGRIATLMAEAWFSLLGIPVRIDVVPFRDYFASLRNDDYDVGSLTWIGDFADPYTFLKMWIRDSNLNDARHNDDDFETLMTRSMGEEGSQRWATLAEAEQLLLERGNVFPISYTPALNIIDLSEIDGWFTNVLDIHPFKYMSIRSRRPIPGVVLR